jgi:hypothetical protein
MRLIGNCKCGNSIVFEIDIKEDDKSYPCFKCGEKVKLQNRYSEKNVESILEENGKEKDESPVEKKERKKRLKRKGY